MPQIDEIKRGSRTNKCIWHACEGCGRQRWVQIIKDKPAHTLCLVCSHKRERCYCWKGGRIYDGAGYIQILLKPDDFFYSMANKRGYIREHRLIMAQHLGRCLQTWEKVHHKDGVRDHNNYNNLEMTTAGSHIIEHSKGYRYGYAKGLIDGRDKQIEELKREIKLLQWQLKEKITDEVS